MRLSTAKDEKISSKSIVLIGGRRLARVGGKGANWFRNSGNDNSTGSEQA